MNLESKRLDLLTTGEKVRVKKLHAKGKLLHKLLDMGFVNSAEIEVVREAPLYDPMQLKIHNYFITIRKSEAMLIETEECK